MHSRSEVALVGAGEARSLLPSLESIYRSVFAAPPWNDPVDSLDAFPAQCARHLGMPDFFLAIARDERGKTVGFAYGMSADADWTDYIRAHLGDARIEELSFGSFELRELALAPEARGRGLGTALLSTLISGRTEPRTITQTLDLEFPARRLCRSHGFRDVGTIGAYVVLVRVPA